MVIDSSKIDTFFAGHLEALRLFKVVRDYIETFGTVKIEVMKTQISFGAKRKFAWVWLPQTWIKKRPDSSITITFVVRRHIIG